MTLSKYLDSRGALTLLVRVDAKRPLEINAPGRTEKKTPKSYTTPELLPRLSVVPRRSHDPLGVD